MSGRGIRSILLCEDSAHEALFRPIMRRMFGEPMRVEKAPAGKGSASQWVTRQIPKLVAYIRRRPSENVGLVVAVDGDSAGLTQRLQELDVALTSAGHAKRNLNDKIAVLVPTWSVETWEYWLCCGVAVDESRTFKQDAGYLRAKRRGDVSAKRAAT